MLIYFLVKIFAIFAYGILPQNIIYSASGILIPFPLNNKIIKNDYSDFKDKQHESPNQ